MDRIQEVTPVKAKFIPDTIIENPDDYFYDVIGVTIPKEGKIEKVVLRFSEPRYPYIKAKPIHSTQQNNDVERTITLKLIPNKELTATILGFGKDVEILEPLALREEITSILAVCCKNYGLLKNDCTSSL